jgi:hypothetical protein
VSLDGSQTLLSSYALNDAGKPVQWHGGVGQFDAWGTWGSATLKLRYSPNDGTTWIDVGDDATLTADGGCAFELGPCLLRCEVSGGTSASLNAKVNRA